PEVALGDDLRVDGDAVRRARRGRRRRDRARGRPLSGRPRDPRSRARRAVHAPRIALREAAVRTEVDGVAPGHGAIIVNALAARDRSANGLFVSPSLDTPGVALLQMRPAQGSGTSAR